MRKNGGITLKTIKKKQKKILFLGMLAIVVALFTAQGQDRRAFASADMAYGEEQRIYSTATIDDDFDDSRLLVTLNRQATLKFKNLTEKDFPELDLVSVEDLTATSGQVLKADINRRQFGETCETRNVRTLDSTRIIKDEFKTILSLTLKEPGKENVLKAIEKLEQRKDIISAEPDFALNLTSANPDDTYFRSGNQWGLNFTNAPQAWNIATGSNTVMVGVIDSGIQTNHPDLNGRVNTDLSRDFTLASPHIPTSVMDTNGHGTHVAGIIGAQGNNGTGITGVGQNIQLVSLRVNQNNHNTYASHLVLAINYAGANDIPILNNSNRAFNITATTVTAFETALQGYDGLFVTAAGNETTNNDTNTTQFPSPLFRTNNLLAVGSLDSNGSRSSFSNWGENTVDIFAPGGAILSTWPTALTSQHDSDRPGYRTESGTSMAAPHVAGVAALMLSVNPDLTPQQLRTNLLNNSSALTITVPDPGFWPWEWGRTKDINVKKLNAYESVKSVAVFNTRILSDDTIEIRGTFGRQLSGSISIPETLNNRSVISIDVAAFINQTLVNEFVLPSSVTSVGDYAFYGCTNLTSITIPNSVTHIGNNAFSSCSNITSITLPNSVTHIGNNAFYECTSLTSISIPNSVTHIGNNAFSYCSNLTSIMIPSSVTSVGITPFAGCTNLSITWNYNPALTASNFRTYLKTVDIPVDVTNIGDNAFSNSNNLTTVTIPNSVTHIGNSAFSNCNSLISIDIPVSVTSVGTNAFSGCTNLSITWNYNPALTASNFRTYLNTVIFPASITTITDNSFSGCTVLENIIIPANITSIGDNAFFGCISLLSITVDSANANYASQDGILYNKTKTAFVHIPYAKTVLSNIPQTISGNVVIPASVTNIAANAFSGCTGLESVIISTSVTNIGENAFFNTAIWNNSMNNSVVYADKWAVGYKGTLSLNTSLLPNTIGISSFAFLNCIEIANITIPASVTSVGNNAFLGCDNLTVTWFYNSILSPTVFGNLNVIIIPDDNYAYIGMYDYYVERPFLCPANGNTEINIVFDCYQGIIQLSGSNNIYAELYDLYDNYIGSLLGGGLFEPFDGGSYKLIIFNSGSNNELIKLTLLGSSASVEYIGAYEDEVVDYYFYGSDRAPVYTMLFYASVDGIYEFEIDVVYYSSSGVIAYMTAAGYYEDTNEFYDGYYEIYLTEGWYFVTFYAYGGYWNLNLMV